MTRATLPCVVLVMLLMAAAGAKAQPARDATLRVTVTDQSGAVIAGARVRLQPTDPAGAMVEAMTDAKGEAPFTSLAPGRYVVTSEFSGFEPRQIDDLRLRAGTTRRELRLSIAGVAENVVVDQSGRDRALDPRSGAFASVLTREQIEALPDDPDEMEAALLEMAGPGAVIRVDGFRGGKLPPKSQLRGIRFRRDSFAAENHGGGLVFVDITTNPGAGPLRGTADFTFRDESLNARHPLATTRGAEQQQNYGFTLNGTLIKDRTSFSLTSSGANSYDSQTIFAAVQDGTVSETVRRPTDRTNISARIDHALSRSHTLRATYQHNAVAIDNLGVGDFNLASRAYSRQSDEDLVRVSLTGPVGRKIYAETRFQARHQQAQSSPVSVAPALNVLDAFTSGGAQIDGGRSTHDVELAADIDYASGRHAARFGLLFEGGLYTSDEVRNAGGTFTFSSLDAYAAGRPSTYTQRTGNPLITFSSVQAGWYAQDDIRLARSMSLSVGLRQELQSHVRDRVNLAPRVGATWSPFRSGSTTIRGGAGLFYDWYEAQTHEQTLRVDGTRQIDLAILNPGYPNPFSGTAIVLPPGRIVRSGELVQPTVARTNLAVEQTLGRYTRLNVFYGYARSETALRGGNVNAPLASGERPDPASGTITEIGSTGRVAMHLLNTGVSLNLPWHRLSLFANYTLGRALNEADGPFSLPADSRHPEAEWGPAANDARHRASAMFNMNLWRRFRLATNVSGSSGLPYNVTTGFDDNGDTVSNDRPAGTGRNRARGKGRWDVGARLSWAVGFGQRKGDAGGAGTPNVVIRTVGGPDSSSMSGFSGGAEDKRWRVELYLAGTNLLNHTNPANYSGVLTSPFFGRATAAGAPRKLEVGTRFTF